MDKTFSISSGVIGPYLSIRGLPALRSRTVDSSPNLQFPPSTVGGQSDPKSSLIWLAWVGLVRLEGFALGAARGFPRVFNISLKSG